MSAARPYRVRVVCATDPATCDQVKREIAMFLAWTLLDERYSARGPDRTVLVYRAVTTEPPLELLHRGLTFSTLIDSASAEPMWSGVGRVVELAREVLGDPDRTGVDRAAVERWPAAAVELVVKLAAQRDATESVLYKTESKR